jgi:alkanesulfonate monooxygenase SsuD/methylene tetrahydromethanopterin reductase-like flavin-dependent oxidoreductase (luciferase family)
MLRSVLSCCAIGSPATARKQGEAFVERTRPDELMVTAQIYDHGARARSYELLMEAVRQPVLADAE